MKCKICSQKSDFLFTSKVLFKYEVKYFQCKNCGFIQTEKPYWLKEAYQSAIADIDIGVVSRSIQFSEVIYKFITTKVDYRKNFMDFAGGYGLFTRLMRDKGLNFFNYDKYCENIFAQNQTITNLAGKEKFEAITAFEVFEHLVNPIKEIQTILQLTNTIIFSTELIPSHNIRSTGDWWYFVPETGQHVAFYSLKTLKYIAKNFNMHLFSAGDNLHMLTKQAFHTNPLIKISSDVKLPSLLPKDFDTARKIAAMSEGKVNKKKSRTNKPLVTSIDSLYYEFEELKILLSKQDRELVELREKLKRIEPEYKALLKIYKSRSWQLLTTLHLLRKFQFPSRLKISKANKT